MSNPFEQRFYNGDQSNTPLEVCRYFGEDHASYGWHKQLDPRWTAEQTRAYNEGYYAIKEMQKLTKYYSTK
jgi:hypothetical protein